MCYAEKNLARIVQFFAGNSCDVCRDQERTGISKTKIVLEFHIYKTNSKAILRTGCFFDF